MERSDFGGKIQIFHIQKSIFKNSNNYIFRCFFGRIRFKILKKSHFGGKIGMKLKC